MKIVLVFEFKFSSMKLRKKSSNEKSVALTLASYGNLMETLI